MSMTNPNLPTPERKKPNEILTERLNNIVDILLPGPFDPAQNPETVKSTWKLPHMSGPVMPPYVVAEKALAKNEGTGEYVVERSIILLQDPASIEFLYYFISSEGKLTVYTGQSTVDDENLSQKITTDAVEWLESRIRPSYFYLTRWDGELHPDA